MKKCKWSIGPDPTGCMV